MNEQISTRTESEIIQHLHKDNDDCMKAKGKKASKYENLEAELLELFSKLPLLILEREFPYVSRSVFTHAKRNKEIPRVIIPVDLVRFIEKYL